MFWKSFFALQYSYCRTNDLLSLARLFDIDRPQPSLVWVVCKIDSCDTHFVESGIHKTIGFWDDVRSRQHREAKDNYIYTMTPSNGIIFRVTGPLWGECTSNRWIPLARPVTRSFDVSWSAPGLMVEGTIETRVHCDAIALIMTSP